MFSSLLFVATAFAQTTLHTDPSFMDAIYGQLVGSPHDGYVDIFGTGAQHKIYSQDVEFPGDDDISDINVDLTFFGGILTYAHFPHVNCLEQNDEAIDVAIIGAPFDTGVSYRPGARFGPEAIRLGARRIVGPGMIPKNAKDSRKSKKHVVVDCGDVPMLPFDNRVALNQLYRAQRATHNHTGNVFDTPKIITMGGDHTVSLMAIKLTFEHYGPVHVIHFDSHIDTWDPSKLGGGITDYMKLNHGTFLHFAHEKGYIHREDNYHVGIRAPMIDDDFDRQHDHDCGFTIIPVEAIDDIGVEGISSTLRDAMGDDPVYITVDIDVLDPAFAPGTGTMEVGGLTSRELLRIIKGLSGLNVVGADVVEVSPPYDTNAEITLLAATSVIDELLKLMTH